MLQERNRRLGRQDYALLVLVLFLTAVKGLAWSIAIPLWQGPDENRHFAVVQFIAEHRRLPEAEEVYRDDENVMVGELADVARLWYAPEQRQAFAPGFEGPREDEIRALDPALRTSTERRALNTANHLAPLYYVLGAVGYLAAYGDSLIERVFAVRLLSVALGVGTVFCAFLIARQVFPERRPMWWTVPVLVSFQPMFTLVTSVVNSDALLVLLYSALLYLAVRAASSGWNLSLAIAAGVALGLGMLTKPIILGALPVLGLAVLYDAWRRRRWLSAVGALALIGALALSICGWWLWRSVRISGALLYANPIQMGVMPVEHPFYGYTLARYFWHYALSLVGGVFVTYWADFGWIDSPLPPGVYWGLLAVCLLAMIGVILYLVRTWQKRECRSQVAGLTLLLVAAFILVLLIGYNTYRTWVQDGIGWGGMQGRYYLGPIAATAVALALGWTTLVPRSWRPGICVALCWGSIILNIVSLFAVVLPRYYL